MRFLWSQMLWWFAVLPLLAGAYVLLIRRRVSVAPRYPGVDLAMQATGSGTRLRRHVPAAFALLALVAALFALARPMAPFTLLAPRMTVVLAIDVSASMEAKDALPDRMGAAKLAAKSFVAGAPETARIAIVSFSSTAAVVQQPTTDREALIQAIDGLRPVGGTAIGSGVVAALVALFPKEAQRLEALLLPTKQAAPPSLNALREPGSDSSRAIVLLTDGENTAGTNPLEAAAIAADHGVRIYTVAFGGKPALPSGARPSSPPPSADEAALRTISEVTQGRHFSAAGTDELLDTYGELGTELAPEREERELTALFSAIAVVFQVVAGALSLAWFPRLA